MEPQGLVVTVIPEVASDGFFSGMSTAQYDFFATSAAGMFYVLQNGAVVWQKAATSYPSTILGTDAGIVYVGWEGDGTSPGRIEAYNFLTNELLWSYSAGSNNYFLKSDASGNLLFSQMDFVGSPYYGQTRLVKLDKATGEVIWSAYPYGSAPDSPTFSAVSPIAIGESGYYYAPRERSELIKYDANGIEQWRSPLVNDTIAVSEANGIVAAIGILNPGYNSVITTFEPSTGQIFSETVFSTADLGFGPEVYAVWGMDILVQGDAIYVSGMVYNDPIINPALGNSEVFVTKFSSTMQPVWTYTFGGNGDDVVGARGTSLSISADGSFTVFTASTDSTSAEGVPLISNKNFIMYRFREDPGTLMGTAQADNVLGSAGSDLINTDAGNDAVNAGAGFDLIIGGSGAGDDTYDGGADTDTIKYTSATAGIIVNLSATSNHARSVGDGDLAGIGTDQLISIENVIAGNFDDFLTGNATNNDIDGQNGIDTVYMSGVRANYSVIQNLDGSFTVADIRPGSPDGVDTFRNIELFTFADVTVAAAGLLALARTGTNRDDTFLASADIESFNGLRGSDTVSHLRANAGVKASLTNPATNSGFAQGDTYTSIENLTGSNFNDTLTGDASANVLNGLDGSDTLDGQGGADTMVGGRGDDTYVVDARNDEVIETANGGRDLVQVAVALANGTYTLSANVEDGILTNSVAFNLTGNSLNNVLTGNDAANLLNGGAGADTMAGGVGNDTYVVEVLADVVTEAANSGTDLVQVAVASRGGTYILTANVENAILTNTIAFNLTGNGFANTLTGNAAANVLNGQDGDDILNGLAGNDSLFGGLGNDTLSGGLGADAFVFNTTPNSTTNLDRITDFRVVDDTIQLENAVFTALGQRTGTLASGAFVIGSAAVDASDRIVYNSATGALFYDSNGNAAGGTVQIATLNSGLALTNSDFVII